MADLPIGPFVKINDVETAQGAPVSEALAQKEGTNDNDLDARATTNAAGIATNVTDIATNITNIATNVTNISSNDTDIATNVTNIATNVTNIATNVSDIAAILQPEIFITSLNPSASAQTIATFTSTPTVVVVGAGGSPPVILVTGATTVRTATTSGFQLEYVLTGLVLTVRETVGTVGSLNFAIAGWI